MSRASSHDLFSYPLSPRLDTGDIPPSNIVHDNLSSTDFNSPYPYHHHNVPPPPHMPYPQYDRYYSAQSYHSNHTNSHNFPTPSHNYANVIRNSNTSDWYNGTSPLTSVVSMDYGPQEISTNSRVEEDRRKRKNAQARLRAAKLRSKIKQLSQVKHVSVEDEILLETYEARRKRKNIRSRERLLEKKEETERILNIHPQRRTAYEQKYLDDALKAKRKKNEGDRLRRQMIKEQKLEMERKEAELKRAGRRKTENKETKGGNHVHKCQARSISPESVKKFSSNSSPPSMVSQLCVPVSPVSTMKHTLTRSDSANLLFQDAYTNIDFPMLFKDH